MSPNRFFVNFLWIPLKFCGQQNNRTPCRKILNRSKWMVELGCSVARQPSSDCENTMSMDQKSFGGCGAHSCSPYMNIWTAAVGLLASVRSSQSLEQTVPFQTLVFCFWCEVELFGIPIPTLPVSCSNLLFFGHMPLPLCSLNSLCSLLYISLSSTLLFLLLALSSLHHYPRHFSPFC